jgi:hypothetical protein
LNLLLFATHSGHQRTSRRARIRSVHPARYQNASMGCILHSMSPDIVRRLCLEWVNLDILSADRPLPVYPDEKTFRLFVGMSQTCQFRTHAPHQKMVWSITSSAKINGCCEIVSLKTFAVLQLMTSLNLVRRLCRCAGGTFPKRQHANLTYQFVGSRQLLQCVGQIKTGSSAHTLYQTPDFRRHGKPHGIMPVLSTSPTSKSQSSGASWIGSQLLEKFFKPTVPYVTCRPKRRPARRGRQVRPGIELAFSPSPVFGGL